LFVRDIASINRGLSISKAFGKASGALLNMDKCWGLWFGSWAGRADEPCGLNWTNDVLKICGIKFGQNSVEINWKSILEKFANAADLLSSRTLSLRSKSNYIQCMLCSKLWYAGSVLTISAEVTKKFQSVIFKVFWGKTMEWVNRETVHLSFKDGGFSVVSVELKLLALRIKHIVNLFHTEAKWSYFAIYWIGQYVRDFEPKFASNLIPHSSIIPDYYKEVLKMFCKIAKAVPNFKALSTKKIYLFLFNERKTVPRIVNKFPRINFTEA